jgi:hypothetical protein
MSNTNKKVTSRDAKAPDIATPTKTTSAADIGTPKPMIDFAIWLALSMVTFVLVEDSMVRAEKLCTVRGQAEKQKRWLTTWECRNGRGMLCLIEIWGAAGLKFVEFFEQAALHNISTFVWMLRENMPAADQSKIICYQSDANDYQVRYGIKLVYSIKGSGPGGGNNQLTASSYPKVFAWEDGKYFEEDGTAVRHPSQWGQPLSFTMDSLFVPVNLEEAGSPKKKSKPN